MSYAVALRRSASLLVLAAIGATGLAACGDDGPKLTVYSGRTDDLIGPIIERFEDETGIDVEVKYGQSADLALLLDEEMAAGSTSVDVFISQSPGALGYLDDAGRLAELPADTLGMVPAQVRDDDNRWVGLTGRQRVVVYNTDLVDASELPSSIAELTDPAWKGRIGVAPENGSFQDFVTAMRALEGDDATRAWLEGLAANDPVTYANNNAIVEAVARGEVEVGLVNHYYNYRRLVEVPDSPSANHVLPEGDPGAILIITGAAMVRDAKESEQALKLIQFLLGAEAQQYFADETFEYPLASGASPASAVPAISFSDVGGIDFSELGGGLAGTREMITAAGLLG